MLFLNNNKLSRLCLVANAGKQSVGNVDPRAPLEP